MQPGPPNLDAGFMGMRFMHGICQIAERHGLLPDTNWHCNRDPSPKDMTIQAAISRSGPQVLSSLRLTQASLAAVSFLVPHVYTRVMLHRTSGAWQLPLLGCLSALCSTSPRHHIDNISFWRLLCLALHCFPLHILIAASILMFELHAVRHVKHAPIGCQMVSCLYM